MEVIAINRQKTVLFVFAAGMVLNLGLFGVKLYVGLSVNSICIWSDSINNLADALSCVLALGFTALALQLGKRAGHFVPVKAEQLLSFVLSVVVAAVGFSFAYSSLERLLYPTPVFFSMKYFSLVLVTAVAKLLMFFFYRRFVRSTGSIVLRVMQTDSLLDFFVTSATLLSFTLTRVLSFAIDAVFGLVISVFIFVNAAKLIYKHVRDLLGVADAAAANKLEEMLSSCKALENFEEIRYDIGRDRQVSAVVFAAFDPVLTRQEMQQAAAELAERCLEQTGIKLRFVL